MQRVVSFELRRNGTQKTHVESMYLRPNASFGCSIDMYRKEAGSCFQYDLGVRSLPVTSRKGWLWLIL